MRRFTHGAAANFLVETNTPDGRRTGVARNSVFRLFHGDELLEVAAADEWDSTAAPPRRTSDAPAFGRTAREPWQTASPYSVRSCPISQMCCRDVSLPHVSERTTTLNQMPSLKKPWVWLPILPSG